jgi:hypothetical protein
MNPEEQVSFKGQWNENSMKWSVEEKSKLEFNDSLKTGTFWITLVELIQYFENIVICLA